MAAHKNVLILFISCVCSVSGYADNTAAKQPQSFPNPLPLEKALGFASSHPAVKLSDKTISIPHRTPLYLDCHRLAYNNLQNTDTSRGMGSLSQLVSPELGQQLYILQSYLDVHLSDLALMADNENMSISYIAYDRAKNRMELKQYSELLVAEKEAAYYEQLQRYQASTISQRLTRTVLAQELGSLDNIPRDVMAMPEWKIPKELPESKAILKQIASDNTWLTKHKDKLDTDQQLLVDLHVQQQVRELLMRLKALESARKRFDVTASYQDLKLEESRTLYEQEVKSDLGDSMSQQTRTQFQQQQVSYCQNMAWAQLNALQAKKLLEQPSEATKKEDVSR